MLGLWILKASTVDQYSQSTSWLILNGHPDLFLVNTRSTVGWCWPSKDWLIHRSKISCFSTDCQLRCQWSIVSTDGVLIEGISWHAIKDAFSAHGPNALIKYNYNTVFSWETLLSFWGFPDSYKKEINHNKNNKLINFLILGTGVAHIFWQNNKTKGMVENTA